MDDDETIESNLINRLGFQSEEYFIQEAISQRKSYKNFEEGAKIIGVSIRKNLNDYKIKYGSDFINLTDRNQLLKSIYKAILKRGLTLTENTWFNIDNEHNIEILESILYYVSITERELKFWEWRKYYLEHKIHWSFLKP